MTRHQDDDGWPYVTRRQWVGYLIAAIAIVIGAYVGTVAAFVAAP